MLANREALKAPVQNSQCTAGFTLCDGNKASLRCICLVVSRLYTTSVSSNGHRGALCGHHTCCCLKIHHHSCWMHNVPRLGRRFYKMLRGFCFLKSSTASCCVLLVRGEHGESRLPQQGNSSSGRGVFMHRRKHAVPVMSPSLTADSLCSFPAGPYQ